LWASGPLQQQKEEAGQQDHNLLPLKQIKNIVLINGKLRSMKEITSSRRSPGTKA